MNSEISEATAIPNWYEEYRTSYSAGEAHGFILHRDIDGYIPEMMSQRRFLIASLAQKRSVVVCYDLARGIHFPDPVMESEARKLLPDQEEREVDPIEQALAGIGDADTSGPDPFAAKKPLEALRVIEQLLRSREGK